MANRAKRIAKEAKQNKLQKKFKLRLKKAKQQYKQPKHPLASTFDTTALKIIGHLPHKDFRTYFYQLTIADRKTFIDIIQHPKIRFPNYQGYLALLWVMVEMGGMVRPFETWKPPKSKDMLVILKSLFVHLFVSYRLPRVVVKSLGRILYYENVNSWKVQLLLGLSAGKGLHQLRLRKLSIPRNSKSNFYFYQAPEGYTMIQALAWAKLRSSKIGYSISNILARKLYGKDSYQQWPSWMSELTGFLERHPNMTSSEINQLLDFLIYQKIRRYSLKIPKSTYYVDIDPLFPDLSLKGRTLASVQRLMEKWQEYLSVLKMTGANGNLPNSKFKGFTHRMTNGRVYTFKQILTIKDLIMEGKRMNHCVGQYVPECMRGDSSIWSLQLRLPNRKIKKVLTIEVLEKEARICQAHGMCNRNHSKEEDEALKAWMQAVQLEMNLS